MLLEPPRLLIVSFFIFLGLDDWNDAQCDADVLTQVLAASQQEYLDSLKTAKESETSQSRRNSSEDSNQEVEHRAPSGGNNNGNHFIFWSPHKQTCILAW